MPSNVSSEVVTTAAIERARRLSIVPESHSAGEDRVTRAEEAASLRGRRQSDPPVHKTVRSVSQYNTNSLLKKAAINGVAPPPNLRKESQSTMVTMLSSATTETTVTDGSVDVFSEEEEEVGEGEGEGEEVRVGTSQEGQREKDIVKQGSVDSCSDSKGNVYLSVPSEEDEEGEEGDEEDGEEKKEGSQVNPDTEDDNPSTDL